MRKIINRIFLIILFLLLGFSYLVYRFFFSMNALPKGELLSTVDSPNGEYTINAYVARGSATVSDSIRAELVFNNKKRFSKNIYWQYRQDTANITWLDYKTVDINGIKLDVTKDTHDFRRKKPK